MQRISWIDTLKGVLLFLICLSHFSNLSYPIKYLIAPTASYWVPMFFVLSGYLYQDKRSFKNYIHKKTKTLLIPYFFFSFLFLIADPNTYKNFLGGGYSRKYLQYYHCRFRIIQSTATLVCMGIIW